MLFTEGHQVPWMNIAAASLAAPALHFSTGIAIAFARSPMISAEIAWELAQNTRGKFPSRPGQPGEGPYRPPLRQPVRQAGGPDEDYVQAVKPACRLPPEGPLQHDGRYYSSACLTEQWTPPRHDYEDVKVDISAVGPIMVRVRRRGGGRHPVHPMIGPTAEMSTFTSS